MTAIAHPHSDWATELVGHSLAYGFLSRVFYQEPGLELLHTLSAEDPTDAWPVDADEPDIAMGLELLRRFLAQWEDDQLPQLRLDYHQLFIGPEIKAAPWESVYLSHERLLFQEQTLAVRDFYSRFGLQAPNLRCEPDDHLGLELAFMLHLCTLALDALDADDNRRFEWLLGAQRTFLRVHLLRWAPDCLGLIIEHAATDYYRGAGHLALGTLRATAKALGVAQDDHHQTIQ